jgi:hypothetical protein
MRHRVPMGDEKVPNGLLSIAPPRHSDLAGAQGSLAGRYAQRTATAWATRTPY